MQTKWIAHSATHERALPDDFQEEYDALSKRMQYLVDYGWKQSTADSFASAKDAAEFVGKLDARIDKILAGQMTIRDGITRTTDPVEKEVKRIIDEALAQWHRERKAAGKKKASEELVEMWLDQFVEKRGEEIRLQAEAIVENRKALMGDFDFDEELESVEEEAE